MTLFGIHRNELFLDFIWHWLLNEILTKRFINEKSFKTKSLSYVVVFRDNVKLWIFTYADLCVWEQNLWLFVVMEKSDF